MLYPFQKALQIVRFSPDFVSQNNNFLTKNWAVSGDENRFQIAILYRHNCDNYQNISTFAVTKL